MAVETGQRYDMTVLRFRLRPDAVGRMAALQGQCAFGIREETQAAMVELIDIFDANLRPLGVASREEVHREAHWHRTFHCWVVSAREGDSLLFQLRSPHAESFPGRFDVSAAGHLRAGESVHDGLREVEEELGVEIPAGSVHFLGHRIEVSDQARGYRDREVQAVHMVRLDLEPREYSPQLSEVAGLVWLPVDAGIRLFFGKDPRERAYGIRYDHSAGGWRPFDPELSVDAFVPRLENYYLAVCLMAERLLRGRFPLAI